MNLKHKINISVALLIIIIIISLAVGLSAGLIRLNSEPKGRPDKENHQGGYQYISPLLTCSDTSLVGLKDRDLKEDLEDMIERKIDDKKVERVSFYFRDLNNGPWIGINEEERFTPASLLKVPVMIAYLKLAERDPSILEQKIKISDEHENTLSQNILPAKKVKGGLEYTIEELLDYMISYSDNVATNALISYVPPDELQNIYADLNMPIPDEKNPENFMTVREYSSFFRILYNASYLNREMSEKALSMLTKSTFQDGLVAGVPANTTIAHKFGERVLPDSKQLHDCGVVYNKNHDYLICVMTRGQDFNNLEKTIQEISALVYQNFTKDSNN